MPRHMQRKLNNFQTLFCFVIKDSVPSPKFANRGIQINYVEFDISIKNFVSFSLF